MPAADRRTASWRDDDHLCFARYDGGRTTVQSRLLFAAGTNSSRGPAARSHSSVLQRNWPNAADAEGGGCLMKLSVLICTRNRAQSLAATLDRFFAQRFMGNYEYELLIVDNASTDETKKVAERFASRARYLFENRHGLSCARNAAIK